MPLQPGAVLDHFEILAAIGAGGMGEVYKARDQRLDRTVAIKVLRQQFTERFTREAQSIAALNHSHICQLYDVGPSYLVMEFIDGAPLKGPLGLDTYDVTSDGKRFLVLHPETDRPTPITVALNWTAGLEK